jgi:hypothetical protein
MSGEPGTAAIRIIRVMREAQETNSPQMHRVWYRRVRRMRTLRDARQEPVGSDPREPFWPVFSLMPNREQMSTMGVVRSRHA